MKATSMLPVALCGVSILSAGAAEDLDTRIGQLAFTHPFAEGYLPKPEVIEKRWKEPPLLPSAASSQ